MKTNRAMRATHKICTMTGLAFLIVLVGIATVACPQEQTDWQQWTAKDAEQVLSKSPWVSRCCWEFRNPADADSPGGGITARIVSSQAVRQAFVRRIQLDKRYERLDRSYRQEIDQRIDTCLNQKFDNYLVLSLSYSFSDYLDSALTSPDQIHLLTSDGRKIVGHLVADPITPKCAWLPNPIKWSGGAPLRNEIAFPRYIDGILTISPADKIIRVVLDFRKTSESLHSVGELDFTIDKLIYQGKPDF